MLFENILKRSAHNNIMTGKAVMKLPRDAISVIKDAENQAHRIVDDAEERAARMIEETEHSCLEFLSKKEAEVTAEKGKQIELLKTKSDTLLKKNADIARKNAEDLESDARKRLDGAVKIILQEIYEQCR